MFCFIIFYKLVNNFVLRITVIFIRCVEYKSTVVFIYEWKFSKII
nr:MAG TPA: hypothetical protein [Bacteriophage sp.]